MPWYLRKSLTRGPVRLNLSKSGLGASFGLKGLRIGVGPRGTYLAGGRGGLYYRQYFNGGRSRSAPGVPAPALTPVPVKQDEPAQNVEFAAMPASDDDVAAEINARLRATRWSKLILAAACVSLLCAFVKGLAILAIVAAAGFVVWSVMQSKREAEARKIEFNYELSEEDAKKYEQITKGVMGAAASSVIWRVTSQTVNRDIKYTAGANRSLERTPTRITFNDQRLTSNVNTSWIWVAGGGLCLLPDRMLFFGSSGVASLDYEHVRMSSSLVNFREDGYVPPDSTNVGMTWQYVNKNGGPDRRFSNNREIPIQRYSEFTFQHPKLSFQLEFSRQDAAEAMAATFRLVSGARSPLPDLGPVRKGALELKQNAKIATVPFTLNLAGPPEKIGAFLRTFAGDLKAALDRGTSAIDTARNAKSAAAADQVTLIDSLAVCRKSLDEVSAAVSTVAHEIEAHDVAAGKSFPSKIEAFIERLAAIEKKLNESALAPEFSLAKAALGRMIDETLADFQKWPNELEAQANGVGDGKERVIHLVMTLDVKVYAGALADSVEAAAKHLAGN